MDPAQASEQPTAYRRELRSELARELHDGPIRALTESVLRLEGFRSASASVAMQTAISEIEADVRSALTSMRQMIRDLREEAPVEDVAANVKTMAGRFASAHSVEVAVIVSPRWPELVPGAVALNLARVVQEALTNATRHGGARHIVVELKADGGRLVVSVSDDGTGIPAEAPAGTGVIGMRERAALLGGRLFERRRAHGTEIRVEAPLR